MAAKLRRMRALYSLYARMDLAWFTQDTFSCSLCIVSDIISYAASISGIFLLSQRFAGIGGLNADQVLFMLGFFTTADGLTFMLSGGFNISHISRRIGRGQLDHMLIQPTPLWMQILTDGFLPVSGNSGFLCGLGLTIVALRRLGLGLTPLWLCAFCLYLLLRMLIVLSANFFAGSAAFYRPASCEELSSLVSDMFYQLGKFPLSGLPTWLTGVLVTVLPVGLTAWLPSMILLGQLRQPLILALPLLVGACLFCLATFAFQKGMRHYVQNSCNRYRDIGHRG